VNGTPVVRSLVVAGVRPWPTTDGYRQRLSNFILALAKLGPVDVFCFDEPDSLGPFDTAAVPAGVRLVVAPRATRSLWKRAWSWTTQKVPRSVTVDDPSRLRDIFVPQLAERYDVMLISHIGPWFALQGLVDAPTIVDIDNLDHAILRATAAERRSGSIPDRLRAQIDRIDAERMLQLEFRCAREVAAVVLCSELDVGRSGLPNAHAVPNGYTRHRPPPERRKPGASPRIIFVGLLSYPPNNDAARWFAEDAMPLVRREIPGATFRIVGRGGEALADLRTLPGVELAGEVDDVQAELDESDVSVVPIRFGAGTRLKVVEALANRLPLVCTTIGCEGIDVTDRHSAMLADSAQDLASACIEVIRNDALRARLVDQGERLWQRNYRWEDIHGTIGDLVDTVIRPELDRDAP